MSAPDRTATLRYTMIVIGVIFIVAMYPLTQLWPSGWSWGGGPSHYLPMILAVYATLGVFLLRASKDPLDNRSLIWFTVWSSLAHAGVMAVQAAQDPAETGHLPGDVAALVIVAGVLAAATLRAPRPA